MFFSSGNGDNDCDFFDDCDVDCDFFGFGDGIEQEAESGDVDQSFEVSGPGDNSNQTAGIQGVAKTGNAQNAIDVVDAGPFVGDFNDDFITCDFDNDGDNDECEDSNDGFVICDFDGDSDNDECEDFNNNDFGLVFCDRDGDGKDDGDDDCFVIFPDFNDGDRFFDDLNDDVVVIDGNDDTEFEFEDVGANIDISPTNTADSSQQVNQAAASVHPGWVWTPGGWMPT